MSKDGNSIWWTVIGVAVIAAIAFFIIVGHPNGGGLGGGEKYTSTEHAFSFTVPKGYEVSLTEPETGEDYIMLLPENYVPPEGGEGPPIIAVHVIPTASQDIATWVRVNTVSNFQLATTPLEDIEVDGVRAAAYLHDGLYPTRAVALLHKGKAILVSGSYLETSDKVYSDFDKVISSFNLE